MALTPVWNGVLVLCRGALTSAGILIPGFAGCVNGSQWFKNRGQWQDESVKLVPSIIIFFDWESDGETDHVGIVQKVENGIVYIVEGNSGDSFRVNQYSVGHYQIYGYSASL